MFFLNKVFTVCLLLILLSCFSVEAHAVGPYYFTPEFSGGVLPQTVFDAGTGLSWTDDPADINNDGVLDASDEVKWADALAYCRNLTYQGHSDWRLPDIRELESLVVQSNQLNMPPGFGGINGAVWSSTAPVSYSKAAWVIDFRNSALYDLYPKDRTQIYVRCVRYGVFDIKVNIDGSGTGNVVSNNGEIDCPTSQCTMRRSGNNTVELLANPFPHSHFTKWTGDCSGSSSLSYKFTVHGDMDCTATFDIDRHTLALTTAGSGSGAVSGGGTYDYGTLTTISATPAVGSRFESWSGDCSGTSDTMLVTVDRDYACTAHFSLNTINPGGRYTLTVNSAGTGSGTVSGGGIFDYGTLTTVSATPAVDSVFERWSGDCSGTSSSIFVYMDKDYTCTAMFRKISVNKFPWAMFLPATIANKHH